MDNWERFLPTSTLDVNFSIVRLAEKSKIARGFPVYLSILWYDTGMPNPRGQPTETQPMPRNPIPVRTWSLDRETDSGQWHNVAVADAPHWVSVHPGRYRLRIWGGVDDVQESFLELLLAGRMVFPPGCPPPEA